MIPEQVESVKTISEELQNSLEELQVAGEELHAQNEELAAARQTVETERQRYQELFDFAPDGYLVTNAEGVIQEANRAAAGLLRVSQRFLAGKPLFVFVAEQERQCFHSKLTRLRHLDKEKNWEVRLQPRNSKFIDAALSVAVVRNREGEVTALRWLLRDITERKQMETALSQANAELRKEIVERDRQQEQLRLLKSVILNTNDAVLITEAEPTDGPGRRIIYANKAFTQITGYTLKEVVGKTAQILQGPKTDLNKIAQVRAALSNWEPITDEVINYRKDGSEFWVEFSFVPVLNESGQYTHWISVQRDITERKLSEQALRESEERFRSLIENALDIITVFDTDGTVWYASPSVERILGYKPAGLVGKKISEYIHPDDIANACSTFTNTIHTDSALSIEVRCQHKDGSWRIFEAIIKEFIDQTGRRSVVVNCRDVTERKRTEEIRGALETEKELSQLQLRFFSMASHEFRTPLSTILFSAQLLQNSHDECSKEKRRRNVQRIETAAKNITHLLDDILTINRAETGKLEVNRKIIDLENFCWNLIEEMQLSAGSDYTITFVSQGSCTNAYMDENLLRSILANLLANAIKYSHKGGNINFALVAEQGEAIFRIRDQGIGIPPEDQQQMFEPFHRGKNVGAIAGTGLGLTLVKKCVNLHGGSIIVASVVGVGTTSTVTLPLGITKF